MKHQLSPAEKIRRQERQRIARDIHDDLGQRLLALKLELLAVKRVVPDLVAGHIDDLVNHVQASVLSLRAVIHDLKPGALDDGIVAAVRARLVDLSRSTGIDHALEADLAVDRDARAIDVVVLRIVQELLSNVIRHAKASKVLVRLVLTSDRLELTVSDNGCGVAPVWPGSGQGLAGVRERAEASGGRLTMIQQRGAGTTVHVTLGLAPC